jgi:hypothetical protein
MSLVRMARDEGDVATALVGAGTITRWTAPGRPDPQASAGSSDTQDVPVPSIRVGMLA